MARVLKRDIDLKIINQFSLLTGENQYSLFTEQTGLYLSVCEKNFLIHQLNF